MVAGSAPGGSFLRWGRMGWAGAGTAKDSEVGPRVLAPLPPCTGQRPPGGISFFHITDHLPRAGDRAGHASGTPPRVISVPPSGTCACGPGGVIDRPVLQGKSPNDTEGREGRVRRRHVQTQGFYRNWFYRVVVFSLGSRSLRCSRLNCRPTRPSRRRVLTPRTSEYNLIFPNKIQ